MATARKLRLEGAIGNQRPARHRATVESTDFTHADAALCAESVKSGQPSAGPARGRE